MMSEVFSVSVFLYLMVPLSFIVGSVPCGLIVTRNSGVDIRKSGSRNIGATNVLRSVGKKPALLTLLGDILKGALPVLASMVIINTYEASSQEASQVIYDFWLGIVGISAVLGHMFSIFLSLKGGKGVATGFGVLLVYSTPVGGIMLLVWIATAFAFKYSSLAAIVAVTSMPVMFIAGGASVIKVCVGVILAGLIVYKHKSNMRNLFSGKESKIGGKK